MLTKRFEIMDIPGDAGIRAYGQDLKELFVNAASGMYSLITDPDEIAGTEKLTVVSENISLEGLLVCWLNELIFHFDCSGFVGRNIVITGLGESPVEGGGSATLRVSASLTGGMFDPGKNRRGLLIKAATYHKLKVEKPVDLWTAEVVFDI